jgi:peptidoglycan L-alanyl-D-glutamate endopeptidase CwlK
MKFTTLSQQKLDTCDSNLQNLFNEIIKHYDCTIIEGHRSNDRQQELLREGKTLINVSKHNSTPSMAVDVAPYPIDWEDTKRFYHFAGFVQATAKQLNIPIIWGGDWNNNNNFKDQTFNDLVHFELI